MGICPISEIYNTGTIPHGQSFLAKQIPMVRGSQMDFTLNDHGEMSNFEAPWRLLFYMEWHNAHEIFSHFID